MNETTALVRAGDESSLDRMAETKTRADESTVYLVTEGYGVWETVGVYVSLDDAKRLAPDSAEWSERDGVLRNRGPGRDLFIEQVPLVR